jgi:hypothetical protein
VPADISGLAGTSGNFPLKFTGGREDGVLHRCRSSDKFLRGCGSGELSHEELEPPPFFFFFLLLDFFFACFLPFWALLDVLAARRQPEGFKRLHREPPLRGERPLHLLRKRRRSNC